MDTAYEERGYLTEDFRLFHLKDYQRTAIDWHYHTFHKIIVFLAGSGSYAIEGNSYPLRAGDTIFVGRGCIHRPEIDPEPEYERYILYLSPEYLKRLGGDRCNLETCFDRTREQFRFVARPKGKYGEVLQLLQDLERSAKEDGFGQPLLQESILLRLLIMLTRATEESSLYSITEGHSDPKIMAMLQYLGTHLSEHITTDSLAETFAISKYHMMRRFKEETGYTIHSYLSSKRLILARELLESGVSATEACYQSGFQDYTAFSRAYRKQYKTSPKGK